MENKIECASNCQRQPHNKRALILSWITVGYNIIEGLVSIAFALTAGSIALIGFGLDSFIESLSGSVMIWRFGQTKLSDEQEEAIEKKAAKYVAYTFFILAAYIAFEAIKDLVLMQAPEKSLPGIIIAIVSIIIMPLLFLAKRQTGKKLLSRSLIADSKQTLICLFLSIALLVGLTLNYAFNFWWADPLASLVIVAFIVREGYKTYKEKELCEC
jgi:divalent metal cation (Fe/Co/Zn/Cd) transporter